MASVRTLRRTALAVALVLSPAAFAEQPPKPVPIAVDYQVIPAAGSGRKFLPPTLIQPRLVVVVTVGGA